MKTYNKIIAVAMAGAICGSTAFSSISLAATKSSEKEEVIYANLTSSGDIEKIYAVNIFEDKDIVDYGVYETVKNMNTMDKINYSNGKITIQNSEDKLYYQGVMKQNTQMPWTIKVRYKLDGVEYAPSELAGKSGKLEISISIKENKNCKKNFFENYALQTVVQLDTNLCENIKSDEATMANVGGLKQLTYTILPGNEKDIKITTDVTDFEMSEIQVNGINLNLGLDKDSIDTSSLTGELDKLKDAVNDLDDGANELNDGAKKLDDGAVTLTDGIKTIQEGLDQLNSKSSSLTSGSSEVLSALKTIQSSLNNVSTSSKDLKQLSSASTSIKSGIDSLVNGLKTVDSSIDTYNSSLKKAGLNSASELAQKNKQAISALGITSTQRKLYSAYTSGGSQAVSAELAKLAQAGDSEAVALYKQVSAGNTDAVTQYVQAAGKLISVETLLKADASYIEGSSKLINGIDAQMSTSSSQTTLMSGAVSLQTNYKKFDASIQDLVSSLNNLMANMTQLKSGINKLTDNYATLDSGIKEYTSAVNKITNGYSKVYEGALDLVSGTHSLYKGTTELTDGTGEFKGETSDLDSKVDDEVDSMIDNFAGGDFEVESFVSDKNTDVDSVQFVIKTEAIKKEEVKVEEEKTEELNFWQKLLNLFRK
ncbi:hypothetical protein [Intestinibacter bartlettii]|uniref:hypothetical protein n=1 Tax=Intestinibacter bartlettii TaxID=261299 RepID=UPI000664965F|nr:hypothetical protein [Intestinibacter bartlettii]KMW24743.1 hypothetical protein HMPREF0977_01738 [Clostridium sp. 1_1_41A1FAA]MDU1253854.1 hypothetical protein [Peptostreptococcaceae bacterium]MDU5921189.1 hypothetical protein [Clostridiales bacterium]MCB5745619.1 hypothetical protein [Intestinibacter bartlettii]MDU2694994.1 hypothetical protein [Intestinibacter bartlettii]